MHSLKLPIEEQRKLKEGGLWGSLSRIQNGSEEGDEAGEEFRRAVVEQWGWLYCPEDPIEELDRVM